MQVDAVAPCAAISSLSLAAEVDDQVGRLQEAVLVAGPRQKLKQAGESLGAVSWQRPEFLGKGPHPVSHLDRLRCGPRDGVAVVGTILEAVGITENPDERRETLVFGLVYTQRPGNREKAQSGFLE